MSSPVVLILGAGPRVGTAVAEKFASLGYKVALASRSGTGTTNSSGFLSLKADFTKPETVPPVFDAVKAEFKAAPSVVVYNAATLTPPPDPENIFSLPAERFAADLTLNTTSAYAAAQGAVEGWKSLPEGAKRTFIYTGNIMNVKLLPVPALLTLGVGKNASSFWVSLADALYSGKGTRFFYADQRKPDGSPMNQELDGPAHGEFFAQLASHEGNVPSRATFVKGKGYTKFE